MSPQFRVLLSGLSALLLLLPLLAAAQDQLPTDQPVETFTFIQPTADPAAATPAAPPTEAPPPAVTQDALPVLVSARSDLELLAESQLGSQRPPGWSGSFDINDPSLAIAIRLDLELLTATVFAVDARPAGWFGAVPSTQFAIARDIRHDLELLADTLLQPSVRPPGWSGADPLMRCNRGTQNLVGVLERGGIGFTADPNSPDFCRLIEIEASQYVEGTLLNQPAAASAALISGEATSSSSGSAEAITDFTLAFFDRNATQRAGVVPRGTGFTPLARSYTQFSNMMLVEGEGFTVFVDYTQTDVGDAAFEALPDVDATEFSAVCAADWCE